MNNSKIILVLLLLIASFLVVNISNQEYFPYLIDGVFVPDNSEPLDFQKEIDGLIYKGNTGNLIENNLYYFGGWEKFLKNALVDLLEQTAGSQGVFLDIGANIGLHSIALAEHSKRVVSIEPYPPVLEHFREMVTLNNIDNVYIYPVGYSNINGSLPYYAPTDNNQGTGSFEEGFSTTNKRLGNLPLVVGDEHLAAEGINHIDLIKIDIEGFERYALLGLRNTLDTSRPIVVLELNNSEGGFSSKQQLLETFPPKYQFLVLRKGKKEGVLDSYSFDFGQYAYLCGPLVRGDYRIDPFDFRFLSQVDLVAIPEESLALLNIIKNENN